MLFTITLDADKMPYDSYPKSHYKVIADDFKVALEKLCEATKFYESDVLRAITAVTSESYSVDTDFIS
jgi:hypothetical protein